MSEIVGWHQGQKIIGCISDRRKRIGFMTASIALERQDGDGEPPEPRFPAEGLVRYLAKVNINLECRLDGIGPADVDDFRRRADPFMIRDQEQQFTALARVVIITVFLTVELLGSDQPDLAPQVQGCMYGS
jgi:hypothetical protein